MQLTEKNKINFWNKVKVTESCWEWTGAKINGGYGRMSINGKFVLSHRVSYEIFTGAIPKGKGYHGMCVLHTCDNRSCVNPKHLFLGTHSDNMRDEVRKGRHPNAKLDAKSIKKARELELEGVARADIAVELGVSRATISNLLNKKVGYSYDV